MLFDTCREVSLVTRRNSAPPTRSKILLTRMTVTRWPIEGAAHETHFGIAEASRPGHQCRHGDAGRGKREEERGVSVRRPEPLTLVHGCSSFRCPGIGNNPRRARRLWLGASAGCLNWERSRQRPVRLRRVGAGEGAPVRGWRSHDRPPSAVAALVGCQ